MLTLKRLRRKLPSSPIKSETILWSLFMGLAALILAFFYGITAFHKHKKHT